MKFERIVHNNSVTYVNTETQGSVAVSTLNKDYWLALPPLKEPRYYKTFDSALIYSNGDEPNEKYYTREEVTKW